MIEEPATTENIEEATDTTENMPNGNLPKLPLGRLTASRLELARKCPGSFAIGHAQSDSAPANTGTQIHRFIEHLITTGEFILDRIEDETAREICAKLDPRIISEIARGEGRIADDELHGETELGPDPKILVEHQFALAPDTAEAVSLPEKTGSEERLHRDYSEAPANYVCGTADVVAVYENARSGAAGSGVAVITDWKAGRGVIAPERNLQLKFHAVSTSLVYNVEIVVVQIAYVFPNGTIHPSAFTFYKADLVQAAQELRSILVGVEEARMGSPLFRTGSHCTYCPAFASCPAQAGAAQAILGADAEELTPQKAAEIWPQLQAVEAATKKVRKALGTFVENTPEGIPLKDPADPEAGKILRFSNTTRDTIRPDVAMPILRRKYGEDADKAVTITKKGLQSVTGSEYKKVFDLIEEEDGVKASYSGSLKEYGS